MVVIIKEELNSPACSRKKEEELNVIKVLNFTPIRYVDMPSSSAWTFFCKKELFSTGTSVCCHGK